MKRGGTPKARRLAELSRELARLELPPLLAETLHQLCATWDQMPAFVPRTQSEKLAEIEDIRRLAAELKAKLEGLNNATRYGVYGVMLGDAAAYPRHINVLDEIAFGCEGHRWFLRQGRSLNARRPPAHQAGVLVASIAHHAEAHGVRVSENKVFLGIVEACLAATAHYCADGETMSPKPLVRREVARRRLSDDVEGTGTKG